MALQDEVTYDRDHFHYDCSTDLNIFYLFCKELSSAFNDNIII